MQYKEESKAIPETNVDFVVSFPSKCSFVIQIQDYSWLNAQYRIIHNFSVQIIFWIVHFFKLDYSIIRMESFILTKCNFYPL